MTMKAKITRPAAPVTTDDAFAINRPRKLARRALRSTQQPSITINGPSLVINVPDRVCAVLGACSEASRKGGPTLLGTLGILLLIAL
jgi:hypothetical protein